MTWSGTKGTLLAGCLYALSVAVPAEASQTPTLAQLPGPAGCISATASSGCTPMTRTSFQGAMAPSPDGRHIYVTGLGTTMWTLSTLRRDPVTGALSEGGCRSYQPTPGCVPTFAMLGARASAVSPDGKNVYTVTDGMAPGTSGAVVAFARNTTTGDLAQVGCTGNISADCPDRDLAVAGASSLLIAPDGRHVYVAAQRRLLTFARADDGALTRVDCIGNTLRECERDPDLSECRRLPPGQCRAADGPAQTRLAFSADSRRLYLASDRALPQVFGRDPASGRLIGLPQPACDQLGVSGCGRMTSTQGLAVTRDGRDVYSVLFAVRDPTRPAVPSLIRSRHAAGVGPLVPSGCLGGEVLPRCAPTTTVGMLGELAVAPDDSAVYAAFGGLWPKGPPPAVSERPSSGVAVLARNPATGALSEASCVTDDGTGGRCVLGSGLRGASTIAVSPDGRNVYVGGTSQIAVLGPAVATTSRNVRFDRKGRTRLALACPKVARTRCRGRMALARAGRRRAASRPLATRRFSIAPGRRSHVAVRLTDTGRATLRRGRRLGATLTLRAGGRISGRSVRQVTLRRARR